MGLRRESWLNKIGIRVVNSRKNSISFLFQAEKLWMSDSLKQQLNCYSVSKISSFSRSFCFGQGIPCLILKSSELSLLNTTE